MGEAGPEEIALVIDEDLRLVLEPAERGAVDDSIAVALEVGTARQSSPASAPRGCWLRSG